MRFQENIYQSSEKNVSVLQKEVKFYHQFHFNSTFKCFMWISKVCFSHLLLIKMISFEKTFITVTQKFLIQCNWTRSKVFVHLLLKLLVDSFLNITTCCKDNSLIFRGNKDKHCCWKGSRYLWLAVACCGFIYNWPLVGRRWRWISFSLASN